MMRNYVWESTHDVEIGTVAHNQANEIHWLIQGVEEGYNSIRSKKLLICFPPLAKENQK